MNGIGLNEVLVDNGLGGAVSNKAYWLPSRSSAVWFEDDVAGRVFKWQGFAEKRAYRPFFLLGGFLFDAF